MHYGSGSVTVEDVSLEYDSLEVGGGGKSRRQTVRFHRPSDARRRGTSVVGTLVVHFDDELEVAKVQLEWADSLTASDLTRFPWTRAIDAARSSMRFSLGNAKALQQLVGAMDELAESGQAPRRPGRRGRSPDFYRGVLARYLQLKEQGDRTPIKTLKEQWEAETGETWSRETIAGWVKKAKKDQED